jgi:hypothetical protein
MMNPTGASRTISRLEKQEYNAHVRGLTPG